MPHALLRALTAVCAVALATGAAPRAQPEPPHRPDDILLGMSAPFTGPAASLGADMRDGIQAAIAEANAAGGVHNRHLRLVALDDGYEPRLTAPNMRTLTDDPAVVAIIGNVGTPTAVAALPIAERTATPFIGSFSGAGVLRREPPDHVVVNFRASYAEEIDATVEALTTRAGLKPADIAFFTQRDAYGDSGFSSGLAALRRRGLSADAPVPNGRYDRNSDAVENALADILSTSHSRPRAVIMVGAYKPCARFIHLATRSGFHPIYVCVSFVGALPLAAELGPTGERVIITQVVPHYDADLPLVRDYHHALAALSPDHPPAPGFGSLEGYAAARMLLLAMNRLDRAPDRASVITSLESLGEFDLGLGAPLSLSPTQHQACHTVWPTVIRTGRVVPADWAGLFPDSKGAAP